MSTDNIARILTAAVNELSQPESLKELFHRHRDGDPLLLEKVLDEMINLSRSILFPGFSGKPDVNTRTLEYHTDVNIKRLYKLLSGQIEAGLCFIDNEYREDASQSFRHKEKVCGMASAFMQGFTEIREVLATDINASYNGGPAAEGRGEIISCCTVIWMLADCRMVYGLLTLGTPPIPRMITGTVCSETGMDINPAARTGRHFTILPRNGRRYRRNAHRMKQRQTVSGCNLGNRNFPPGDDGKPVKGISRHPILEDNVIVYSSATKSGRVTI